MPPKKDYRQSPVKKSVLPTPRQPVEQSPPTTNDLSYAGVVASSTTQIQVSPTASPLSSIDETKSEEIPLPLLVSSPKTKLEIFQLVEILQNDIIEIRSDHTAKHDHLVNLLDMLLSGQASEKETSTLNATNIHALQESHAQIVTKVATASTASSDHIAKIASFEKKIDDFLSSAPVDDSSDNGPCEHQVSQNIMPSQVSPAYFNPPSSFNPPSRPIPTAPIDEDIYHNDYHSLAPKVERDSNFSITRSIPPIIPSLSQVKLTDLSTKAVFIWGESLTNEQLMHHYEVIRYGLYISERISKIIQARNNANPFHRPIRLNGSYISMSNNLLFDVIVEIVSPKTPEEWKESFNDMVRFPKLPQGHIFDITRYEPYYVAIIEYIFLLKKVVRFLDWKARDKLSPQLRTKDGKIGFMELIWRKIPAPLGEKLHLGLSSDQIKECRNVKEYLSYFSQQNQNLYDDSLVAKRNRLQYENNSVITSEGELNRKGYGTTGKSPIDPKLNYMNTLQPNSFMLLNNPYVDVEKDDLPENTHDFLKPIHTNRYNPTIDENVHDFNYFDATFDAPFKDSSNINPMYHEFEDHPVEGHDQDDDWVQVGTNTTNLHVLDITQMRTLPCFNALMGTCKNGPTCNYSHSPVLLQAAYDKRVLELATSPFAKHGKTSSDTRRSGNFPISSSIPPNRGSTKPLREIYNDIPSTPSEKPTQVTILNRNVV
jgi:hypothetical protein